MAVVESLLSALVRADGEALVLHVGERPYVVVGTQTTNISTHALNLDAMTSLLAQLLPADAHTRLEESGAAQHVLEFPGADRFIVVAAKGGDEIWIEIRRRPAAPAPAPAAPQADNVISTFLLASEPDGGFRAPEPVEVDAPAAVDAAAAPESSAVVVPMTRTVRIEVPPRAAVRTVTDIERLLRVAAARGASALYLPSESRPWMRVDGDVRPLDSEASFVKADVERAILEIAPRHDAESIVRDGMEWVTEFDGIGSVRCTTFADHRGPGVLLRLIATRAATADQLGLSDEVQALATEPQGIVLVAGPRGGGKSTLLSALVDLANRQRAQFIVTLERQIRLIHDHKSALVIQREIRGSADEALSAARSALRATPDVLVIDDLLTPHMVPLLLTAASEGLLVFVSITAPSAADAVERFVEHAPTEARKDAMAAMAESFRGAVAQVLLKKAGGGLVAAREVLLATPSVIRAIGDDQLGQLPLALESGRKHGMVSFTDALVEYVRSGMVDAREAFRKAPDRDRLVEHLKREGVDTTVIERLA